MSSDVASTSAGARFAAMAARLERLPLSVIQLTARIGVGAVFFRSGLLKVSSWQFAVQLFRDEYKVPLLDPLTAARITTAVELGVPVLLLLGLATRLATLPLLGMIAVIQVFVYPNAWSDHLLWTTALLLLLTRGAGAISVDHLMAKAFMPTAADRRSGCT